MCSSLRSPLFNTRVGLIRRENKSHPLFLVRDRTWHCMSMAAWGDCAYLVINGKKIATAEREDKKIAEKRSLTLIQRICMDVGAVSLGNSPKRYPSVLKKHRNETHQVTSGSTLCRFHKISVIAEKKMNFWIRANTKQNDLELNSGRRGSTIDVPALTRLSTRITFFALISVKCA